MTPEFWAIIGVGVTLGAAILPNQYSIRQEIVEIRQEIVETHKQIGGLRERMARLEGLFEGFTGRSSEKHGGVETS